LFWADRAHHHNKVVMPFLNQDKLVLQDRGYLSTIVYQCGIRQFPPSILEVLHNLILNTRLPNMILWVDTPLEITLERLKSRQLTNNDITLFDVETMQRTIYGGYQRIFQNAGITTYSTPYKQIIRLDGTKSVDEIASMV